MDKIKPKKKMAMGKMMGGGMSKKNDGRWNVYEKNLWLIKK